MLYRPKKGKSKKRIRKKNFRFLLFFVLPFLLVLFIFSFFLNFDYFKIKEIEIISEENSLKEEVYEIVEENLSEKYFLIFSKNNFLYLPSKEIKKEVFENIKIVKNLSFSKNSGEKLSVEVLLKERKYVLLKQIKKDEKILPENVNFVFEDGTYRWTKVREEDRSLVKIYLEDFSLGVLEKEIFEKIDFLNNFFESKNIKINKIYFDKYEDIVFETPGGEKIIIDGDEDLKVFEENFSKLLLNEVFEVNKKSKLFVNNFAYINTLNGNKIVYCLAGEVCDDRFLE